MMTVSAAMNTTLSQLICVPYACTKEGREATRVGVKQDAGNLMIGNMQLASYNPLPCIAVREGKVQPNRGRNASPSWVATLSASHLDGKTGLLLIRSHQLVPAHVVRQQGSR